MNCQNCEDGYHRQCTPTIHFLDPNTDLPTMRTCECMHIETTCEACEDKGWLHAYNTDKDINEIQRCDSCGMIVDDAAAAKIHDATCGCAWKHFLKGEFINDKT